MKRIPKNTWEITNQTILAVCPDGGIGRHDGLRSRCRKVWGFESLFGHQRNKKSPKRGFCLCNTLYFLNSNAPRWYMIIIMEYEVKWRFTWGSRKFITYHTRRSQTFNAICPIKIQTISIIESHNPLYFIYFFRRGENCIKPIDCSPRKFFYYCLTRVNMWINRYSVKFDRHIL